ncbi:MAG: thioredoxin-dependent thiol peroxidase [Chloroflexota bacterium]
MTEALIIDDNRSTADALLQMLGLLHVPARVAYGSSAAMSLLSSFTPSLVLLDITMPGVDGMEVLGFLRREPRLAGVPVLVITLDDQPETRERAFKRGASAVIIKPATLDVLEDSLRRLGALNPREERARADPTAPPGGARAPEASVPRVQNAPTPIRPGLMAPDFELQDETGVRRRLSEYRGKVVVLYFYPADDTPGCTKEACNFRDYYSTYEQSGATVLGVSPDTVQSHAKFKQKFRLPFTLLADLGHRVCSMYGVWGQKKFMGRTYEGVLRTTFLVDRAGRIGQVFENVRPAEHSQEVLAALRSL